MNKALMYIASIVFVGMMAFLIWQAVSLHSAEVAQQIAEIGYYKKDVYLDFGRHAMFVLCIIGSVVAGFASLIAFLVAYNCED